MPSSNLRLFQKNSEVSAHVIKMQWRKDSDTTMELCVEGTFQSRYWKSAVPGLSGLSAEINSCIRHNPAEKILSQFCRKKVAQMSQTYFIIKVKKGKFLVGAGFSLRLHSEAKNE